MSFIEIGRVLRPRGLKGEVKVEFYSENRFLKVKESGKVLFEKGGNRSLLEVESVGINGNFAFIKFGGIDSVETAETLRDGILLDKVDNLEKLPSGSYYQFELVGFAVYADDSSLLGSVVSVVDYPSCDALEVSLVGGRNITVPMVKSVVVSVDVASRKIVLKKETLEEIL